VLLTALVFFGYTLLRKRHAENLAASAPVSTSVAEQKGPVKAVILVDDALLEGNKTTLGGTVRNTSTETLQGLSVELELKHRADGTAERKIVALQPASIGPQQEGRYSIQLKAQDYSAARVVALKTSANQEIAYTTAAGQKRPLERLESKTITVDKRSSKRDEFLNSPDNPARVP
jgi:hypothetical protein